MTDFQIPAKPGPVQVPRHIHCLAHLPLVRFENGLETFDVFDGEFQVRALPFESWARIDYTAGVHRDGYEKTAPVFVVASFIEERSAPLEETRRLIWSEFEQRSYGFYFSLLLATAQRIPEPELSRQYYCDPAAVAPISSSGPFEYEALAYVKASHPIHVTASDLKRAESLLRILREGAGLILDVPEVERARDILFGFSRPEFDQRSDFLHCIAATENLLVPEPANATFAAFRRRAAVLLGPTWGPAIEAFVTDVYELRSRLAHGDDVAKATRYLATRLKVGTDNVWSSGRLLLCEVVQALLPAAAMQNPAVRSAITLAAALDAGRTLPTAGGTL